MVPFYQIRGRSRHEHGSFYALTSIGNQRDINGIKQLIESAQLEEHHPVVMDVNKEFGAGRVAIGDMTPWLKGCPNAHIYIVSERFLDYIKTKKVPPFRVYNIQIENKLIPPNKHFLIHILGDAFDDLDYASQIFYKRNLMTDANEGYLQSGQFKDKGDMLSFRGKLIAAQSQTLFMDVAVYRKQYDIFWGFANLIVVTEQVKAEIENRSFAIDFSTFNKYQIMWK